MAKKALVNKQKKTPKYKVRATHDAGVVVAHVLYIASSAYAEFALGN